MLIFKVIVTLAGVLWQGMGGYVYAAPAIVYRVDARAPDEIFMKGFKSWGSNDDVLAHVAGITTAIGSRDSAFVATTEDMAEAIRFLNHFVSANPGAAYWLYRIYADNRFYSTNSALQYIMESRAHYDAAVVTAARTLYKTFHVQKEWLGKDNIAPSLIIDGAGYQWDRGTNQIKPVGLRTNTNSRKPDTVANDSPYHFTPQDIATYAYIKPPGCNVISDDFCPDYDEFKTRANGSTCMGLPIGRIAYKFSRVCGSDMSGIFSLLMSP
jgi:hypothetical protein